MALDGGLNVKVGCQQGRRRCVTHCALELANVDGASKSVVPEF